MGMSGWLMDMEEEFYTIADKIVGECEAFNEFVVRMKPHYPKMYAFYNDMEIEEPLYCMQLVSYCVSNYTCFSNVRTFRFSFFT